MQATTFSADTQVHKFAKDLATDETGKCQELVKRYFVCESEARLHLAVLPS